MAPLKKDRARASTKVTCQRNTNDLRLCPPCIPYANMVMVMALAFHTEYPNGVGGALNIFIFPDLSLLFVLDRALLTIKWDSILRGGRLNSFADTSMMIGKQKISPTADWDEATSQLEAWSIFCTVFLGNKVKHPAPFDMFLLIKETPDVSLRLYTQAWQKSAFPAFPAALLCLIQQDFNESFYQDLDRRQRFR